MIEHCSDHAANERTYLAWLGAGITLSSIRFVRTTARIDSPKLRVGGL